MKEFDYWKNKIEKGEAGVLFVESIEAYIGTLEMELDEYGLSIDEDTEENEQFMKLRKKIPYIVTIVGINNKLGRLIKLGVTKELAMEFEKYQDKLINKFKLKKPPTKRK